MIETITKEIKQLDHYRLITALPKFQGIGVTEESLTAVTKAYRITATVDERTVSHHIVESRTKSPNYRLAYLSDALYIIYDELINPTN